MAERKQNLIHPEMPSKMAALQLDRGLGKRSLKYKF